MAMNSSRGSTAASFALIGGLSIALFAFFTLINNSLFLSMLAAVGVFALLGAVHYAFWGRADQQAARAEQRAPSPPDRRPGDYHG